MQAMEAKLGTTPLLFVAGMKFVLEEGPLGSCFEENLKSVELVGGRCGHLVLSGELTLSEVSPHSCLSGTMSSRL
jgi:hypothetical protein